MFGSKILDVAIGLIFVYLLLSLIASAVREGIEAFLKSRASHLEAGIRTLLQDPEGNGLAAALYNHPLISSLFAGEYSPSRKFRRARTRLPSYIPAGNFAVALLDIVARGPSWKDPQAAGQASPELTLANVRASISNIQNPPVQRALLVALDTAEGDLNRARVNIEGWFNSSMDRVSGWYKRETQLYLLVIGLLLTVGANVNTLTIATYLYRDDAAREAIVQQAQAFTPDTAESDTTVARLYARLTELKLPIGWNQPQPVAASDSRFWDRYVAPAFGWLLTAFAISFGAPFWFDLLNRMMVVRSTVKPHEKSPEEASQDRQPKRDGQSPPPPPTPTLSAAPTEAPSPTEEPPPPAPPEATAPPGGEAPAIPESSPAVPAAPAAQAESFQPHEWATDNPDEGVL
ncbi:MAG: hypothetical protein JO040_11995 [Gemmatimonadetes bacterium]|nr:hypothetical protein [Gemmatimonadota bacterium]